MGIMSRLLSEWIMETVGGESKTVNSIKLFYFSRKFGIKSFTISDAHSLIDYHLSEDDSVKNRTLSDVIEDNATDYFIVSGLLGDREITSFKTKTYNIRELNKTFLNNFKVKDALVASLPNQVQARCL